MTTSSVAVNEAQPASTEQSEKEQGDTAPNADHEEDTHLKGVPLYALLASLFLLIIIVTLDISILSTAIPRITDDFHTIADIGWYGSSFLIAQCAVQPLAGRIYSIFPYKQSFISFLAVFELGSLLSGVAVSSKMLVVARAVCGIGSAGLVNGALSIIGIAAPAEKRSMYMGLFMAISSAGQIIGPLIGGALTEDATWRWCFYLNLPVGAVALLGFLFIRLPPVARRTQVHTPLTLVRELDILGFLVFAPASAMLLLALEWGGTEYAWSSATVIGLLCGSAAVFTIFVVWERRQQDNAMIPASVVGVRHVYVSCILAAFQGGAMLILTYYLSLWFQVVKHRSPVMSAVGLLPTFAMQVFGSVIFGVLVNRLGYVMPPLLFGNSLIAISYGLLSALRASAGTGLWVGYEILQGSGRGVTVQIPIIVVQNAVPKSKVATASAITMWSTFFGGAIILSLAQTVFINLLKSALHHYVPSLDAGRVISAGATGYASVVPDQLHPAVLQAYNQAITHTFYLGIGVSAVSLVAPLGLGSLRLGTKHKARQEPAVKGQEQI